MGEPDDWSVKFTSSGAVPEVGVPLQDPRCGERDRSARADHENAVVGLDDVAVTRNDQRRGGVGDRPVH